mgnify:CR=1 FL=1
MMSKTKLDKEVVVQAGLLILLFGYLLIRAIAVVPMHDEIATFYHYIETGRIFEMGMVFDANNHFLNSYLGRFFYLIGLDHYFFFRIGNVLAFVLYFFGLRKLIQPIENFWQRILTLVACCSVPFVLEYFAYSRGYGMAMGFFVWLIYYAIKWANNHDIRSAFMLAFFTFFTLFSNLIFTGSFCIVFALLLWIFFVNRTSFSTRDKWRFWIILVALLTSVSPLMAYSFFLKKIGALYYGSLDGLWEVTGKTLSTYVFFVDGEWMKWVLLLTIVTGAIIYVKRLIASSINTFLKKTDQLIALFFYGNLVIILILALVMQVNYPEDRAGMYLIPLFILLFSYNLQKFKWTRLTNVVLLFFPISLLAHLSTDNSVFSPDMRIRTPFYEKVRAEIKTDETISLYPTMHLVWNFCERGQEQKIVPNAAREFDPSYDLILTRSELVPKNLKKEGYHKVLEDNKTGQVLLRKQDAFKRIVRLDEKITPLSSARDTIELLEIPISESWRNRKLIVQIKSEIQVDEEFESLMMKYASREESGKEIQYGYTEQRWNHKRGKKAFPIEMNYVFKEFMPNEKKLHLYLLNRFKRKVSFAGGSIKIISLEPNYGTR